MWTTFKNLLIFLFYSQLRFLHIFHLPSKAQPTFLSNVAKHVGQNSSRFTFSQVHIGGSGGWIVGVYLARSSIGRVLGFRLVDASGHTQTHTHMHTAVAVTHRLAVQQKEGNGGEKIKREKFLEVCSRWVSHSKVPVWENLISVGRISAFYSSCSLLLTFSMQTCLSCWILRMSGRGRGQVPSLHLEVD